MGLRDYAVKRDFFIISHTMRAVLPFPCCWCFHKYRLEEGDYPCITCDHNPNTDKVLEIANCIGVIKALVEIVQDYHKDAGGCDHSVGICFCGEYRILDYAEDIINKYESRGGENDKGK